MRLSLFAKKLQEIVLAIFANSAKILNYTNTSGALTCLPANVNLTDEFEFLPFITRHQ
jgi:hypothetical protein